MRYNQNCLRMAAETPLPLAKARFEKDGLKPPNHDVELNVLVEGDRIIVTRTGSSFRAAYAKSPDGPKLVQSMAMLIDKGGADVRKEFEVRAWEAANEKAHELGWL